jgi:hypothetical protein
MTKTKDIIKEITSRKDPQGYYVLVAVNNKIVHKIVERYAKSNLLTEVVGDIIIIRCKSRRIAEELARSLLSRNLLQNL